MSLFTRESTVPVDPDTLEAGPDQSLASEEAVQHNGTDSTSSGLPTEEELEEKASELEDLAVDFLRRSHCQIWSASYIYQ